MTLTNYQDNGHGIEPLSIDQIRSQLTGCVTERLRRCKGLLCAVADEGYLEFLHSPMQLFAWLGLHCSIDWEVGEGLVTKGDLHLHLLQSADRERHSPAVKPQNPTGERLNALTD